MPRFAAFLRGVNITNRRVKNEELRASVEAMGFEDVAIFRASGNVIRVPPRPLDDADQGNDRADRRQALRWLNRDRSGYHRPTRRLLHACRGARIITLPHVTRASTTGGAPKPRIAIPVTVAMEQLSASCARGDWSSRTIMSISR